MSTSFPRKIAEGEWFCNRTLEKKHMKRNISEGHHTLIVSPRRYGKTSLAFQCLNELNIPFGYTQFLNAYQPEMIIKRLCQCLSELLTQIESPTQKALKTLGQFFGRAKLSLKLSHLSISIEIEPLMQDHESLIDRLLQGIEQTLAAKRKKAVIFLDEFQDIAETSISDSFQSLLRDFAQQTKHISFIISGSSRHLLNAMFSDRNKPFYKLFDHLKLTRITQHDYSEFLQKKALIHWEKPLTSDILKEIADRTDCHAYYVNRLCAEIWQLKALPTIEDVYLCWENVLADEFDSLAEELSHLTKNQRIILQTLAECEPVLEPTSREFLIHTRLAHGSVLLALKALHKQDFIEKTPLGFRLNDPAMKAILIR